MMIQAFSVVMRNNFSKEYLNISREKMIFLIFLLTVFQSVTHLKTYFSLHFTSLFSTKRSDIYQCLQKPYEKHCIGSGSGRFKRFLQDPDLNLHLIINIITQTVKKKLFTIFTKFLPLSIWTNRMNSTFSSNRTRQNSQRGKELNKFCPPNRRDALCLCCSLHPSSMPKVLQNKLSEIFCRTAPPPGSKI